MSKRSTLLNISDSILMIDMAVSRDESTVRDVLHITVLDEFQYGKDHSAVQFVDIINVE